MKPSGICLKPLRWVAALGVLSASLDGAEIPFPEVLDKAAVVQASDTATWLIKPFASARNNRRPGPANKQTQTTLNHLNNKITVGKNTVEFIKPLGKVQWISSMIAFTVLIVMFLFANATYAEELSVPKKVACIGDSITFGAFIQDRNNKCYPAQLSVMLGESWIVKNFGKNGTTLLSKGDRPWIKEGVCKSAMDFAPDIVVINLGANDTKPQNIGKHPDEFVTDYLALIEQFRALPTKPQIYICNPVEVFDFTGGIRYSVMEEEIRPRIKIVAEKSKCVVIDLKTPFVNRRDLLADLVHPNADGAKVMAEIIAKAIKSSSSHPAR